MGSTVHTELPLPNNGRFLRLARAHVQELAPWPTCLRTRLAYIASEGERVGQPWEPLATP
jgi:hypothetical protein